MSNFTFIETEFSDLYPDFRRAERSVRGDPRAALFYSRRALEALVNWIYDFDAALTRPYDDNLNALMRERSFTAQVPRSVQDKMHLIRKRGNGAVHDKHAIKAEEALQFANELFHIAYWFGRTYGSDPSTVPEKFDPKLVPPSDRQVARHTIKQYKELAAKAETERTALRQQQEENEALKAQIVQMQAQVTQQKVANQQIPDTHDYSEAETRERLIDVYLREAGWDPNGENVSEYEVRPMPNKKGVGYVDYVLWGDDGLPLAVVEAKQTKRGKEVGKQQAKLYADALEAMTGQRPIIFYTNGYEIALWDHPAYPPREVQGFYNKEELQLLVQRRSTKKELATLPSNPEIAGRYYQQQAIRRVAENLTEKYRRSLIVMATGAGKTRTTIALVDLLMRANWVKRVLFLADRTALVKQAVNSFKEHLPTANAVNLLEEKEVFENRVVASTYQTMMGQIDEKDGLADGSKRFGVGHFDLIIIDEAHRSVYQKYRAIFDYFDGYLLGLTATPQDEVDRNTYDLFNVEDGVPTYAYDLDVAIADGFLVPPNPISVPLKFIERGIRYDDLSDDEQMDWDLIEWDESGDVPDGVDAAAINRWLFNKDTVDKVLATLMEHGQKVAGGDRLGKTIIFAKNQAHAQFIQDRFDLHYPHLAGEFASVITYKVGYAQSLIDDFSKQEANPHIAISVDMLDTGIDVPEVVNLVFFKLVRSKTKFFQMLGRGTRLCLDLFGVDEHKTSFNVFDVCQNFEFFNYNPRGVRSTAQPPLSQRLFDARLDLLGALTKYQAGDAEETALITGLADGLHGYVAAMPLENFLVRPQRKYVDPFLTRARWQTLSAGDISDLKNHVSGLPSQTPTEPEAAKRFDLLMLQLQLAQHEQNEKVVATHRTRVIDIASRLQTQHTIPKVQACMDLLAEVQTDLYWQAATPPRLETARVRLREITQFLPRRAQKMIETDFVDELGTLKEAQVSYITGGVNVAQYRKKVEHFVRSHDNHLVIQKIRRARPLTPTDLAELERFFFEADETGSRAEFEQAYGSEAGLSALIRSTVGLDRRAAKELFGRFLDAKGCTADQINFVNHIINHLTKRGIMNPSLLYDRPFIDIDDEGLDGLFGDAQADEIVQILRQVNASVTAKAA